MAKKTFRWRACFGGEGSNASTATSMGPVRLVSDATGQRIEADTYRPFGEQQETPTGTPPESKGFIGERFDADAGLQFLNARYYDPKLGLFLQPDWWEVTAPGVRTNRYGYAGNDPVNGSDVGGNVTDNWFDQALNWLGSQFDSAFPQASQRDAVANATTSAANLLVPGKAAIENSQAAFDSGNYVAAGVYGVGSLAEAAMAVFSFGEYAVLRSAGEMTQAEALLLKQGIVTEGIAAGDAGRYGDLARAGKAGDELTPHHMPQAAQGYTTSAEGGALVLPHSEHVLTRTYGSAGRATLRSEGNMAFRDILARDIRDIRSNFGANYNSGLRALIDYYKDKFPGLIGK